MHTNSWVFIPRHALYEGNNIISTFRKGKWGWVAKNLPKVTAASARLHYSILSPMNLPNSIVFTWLLRLMYQVYGSFYSFVCRKTRAITILKASNTLLPIHLPACVRCFLQKHMQMCSLRSAGWRRGRRCLPGMWTILSDALMSLAEPKAFRADALCHHLSITGFPGRGISGQRKRSLCSKL